MKLGVAKYLRAWFKTHASASALCVAYHFKRIQRITILIFLLMDLAIPIYGQFKLARQRIDD
jgi:hypothetical protein